MYSKAAADYTPRRVKLLWIAEAPPRDSSRYFYFEEMSQYDWLFRGIMKAMFPSSDIPGQGDDKSGLLDVFKEKGAFLIDLCEDPYDLCYEKWWPRTAARIRCLDPKWIMLVKVTVCDFVYPRLADMGFSGRLLTTERVPFPGSGQQRRFHEIVDPLIRALYDRA